MRVTCRCSMMRIIFIYCMLSNAQYASSIFFKSESHSTSSTHHRTSTSTSNFLGITAHSHPPPRQRATSSVIIASADLAGPKKKHNPHNLYRLIGRICNIIKQLGSKAKRILLRRNEEEKPATIEKRIQSFFTKKVPDKGNEIKKLLQPVGNFFQRKFPKNIPQSPFHPSLPSFPNININIFNSKSDNNQKSKKQNNIWGRRFPKKNIPQEPIYVLPSTWGGSTVTEKEKIILISINERRLKIENMNGLSPWLKSASGTDFLRFLRAKNGNEEEAWTMIHKHAKWRVTKHGADTILRDREYDGSVLHRELFWLGVSAHGLPVLVIRTQAHDGADYQEDPKVFTSFMVLMIEEGMHKYGVGISRQVCVVLDRGLYVKKGIKKEYKTDMGVVPNLVKLFQHLYGTLSDNYPDLLYSAQVVPASWFFSMCYRITSRVMDSKSRDKFVMVEAELVTDMMADMFPVEVLPPHLGGTSTEYGEEVKEILTTNDWGVQSNKMLSFWRGNKKNTG